MLHADWISAEGRSTCVCSPGLGSSWTSLAIAPEADSLRRLARRIDAVHDEPVCANVTEATPHSVFLCGGRVERGEDAAGARRT
jgi:hypothetical protein